MSWLLSVYIGAAVFGVGITLVDLFGLIGSHDGDHQGGHEGALDHDVGGHDVGGHDAYDTLDHDTGEAASIHAGGTEHSGGESEHGQGDEHEGSLAGHDRSDRSDRPDRRSFLLGLLSVFRNLIYFCLGFGPVGWFSLATSGNVVTSLLWSVPVGGVALVGTRLLRRFMRRDVDSAVSTSELLMERGVVTVSISAGEMGKVRVKLGELYVDRFARASDAKITIPVGTSIRITDITDDCVYVEEIL